MIRRFKVLTTAFAVYWLTGASSCSTPAPIELTIFHTNDVHSHLRAAKSDPYGLGGLARLATLLKTLRHDAPASLTLDAGDWSEGTWYYNLDIGANMLRLFDRMGYDAVCLGNHDFLNGPTGIVKTIETAKVPFPVLAANLDMSDYSEAATLRQALPPTLVKTVGGVTVGMIGLTTFGFLYDSYMAPVRITDPIKATELAAAELRSKVDVILVISHNDFDVNLQVARSVLGVSAVISGHTHRKTPQAVLVKNAGHDVPVVETGDWGRFLGDLRFTVDRQNKSVQLKSYQLHSVSPEIAEDPEIARIVDEQDVELSAIVGSNVHEHVTDAELDLGQKDHAESALGNLAVKAYRSSTGADLSLEEISFTGVSIAKGPVTLMDLHDVIPHLYNQNTGKEWTLQIWNARGSDLSLVFEVFYTVAGLMPLGSPLGWLSADNAHVVWDPSIGGAKAGPAIRSLKIGGVPLDPSRVYSVALSEGLLHAIRLAAKSLQLDIDLSRVTDTGMQAWQAVVEYAQATRTLALDELRVGGKVFVEGGDLAVFPYSLSWDGSLISLEVENHGTQPTVAGIATCFSGQPNDPVLFNTEFQVRTPVGSIGVPVLNPGQRTMIQIPWDATSLAKGTWPLSCEVRMSAEKYEVNNVASKVFRN